MTPALLTNDVSHTVDLLIEHLKEKPVDSVLALSGGIDSTVLVHHLVAEGYTPLCVYVQYGSVAQPGELRVAQKTCKKLGLTLTILNFDLYGSITKSPLMGNTDDRIKGLQFWAEGRNAYLGMLLTSIASALGVEEVYLAINADDANDGYKDTDRNFLRALNLLLAHGFHSRVEVFSPWLDGDYGKADVIQLGIELGINWTEETYSCSSSAVAPCCKYSECESCHWRQVSFGILDMPDPFLKN